MKSLFVIIVFQILLNHSITNVKGLQCYNCYYYNKLEGAGSDPNCPANPSQVQIIECPTFTHTSTSGKTLDGSGSQLHFRNQTSATEDESLQEPGRSYRCATEETVYQDDKIAQRSCVFVSNDMNYGCETVQSGPGNFQRLCTCTGDRCNGGVLEWAQPDPGYGNGEGSIAEYIKPLQMILFVLFSVFL